MQIMLNIKIYRLQEDNNINEAFKTAETIMLASKPHKYPSLYYLSTGQKIFVKGCNISYRIISDCESSETLKACLDKLTAVSALAKSFHPVVKGSMSYRFEAFRTLSKRGFEENIDGLSTLEIETKFFGTLAEYYDQKIKPNLKENTGEYFKEGEYLQYYYILLGGEPKNFGQQCVKMFTPFAKDIFVKSMVMPILVALEVDQRDSWDHRR